MSYRSEEIKDYIRKNEPVTVDELSMEFNDFSPLRDTPEEFLREMSEKDIIDEDKIKDL